MEENVGLDFSFSLFCIVQETPQRVNDFLKLYLPAIWNKTIGQCSDIDWFIFRNDAEGLVLLARM